MTPAHRCLEPAYLQGRKAFDGGVPARCCPYPKRGGAGSARYWWFMGWYDAKHEKQSPRQFSKQE